MSSISYTALVKISYLVPPMRSSGLKGFHFLASAFQAWDFPPPRTETSQCWPRGRRAASSPSSPAKSNMAPLQERRSNYKHLHHQISTRTTHLQCNIYISWCVEAFKISCSFDMHHIKPPCKQRLFLTTPPLLSTFSTFIDQPLTSTVCFLYLCLWKNLESKPEPSFWIVQ